MLDASMDTHEVSAGTGRNVARILGQTVLMVPPGATFAQGRYTFILDGEAQRTGVNEPGASLEIRWTSNGEVLTQGLPVALVTFHFPPARPGFSMRGTVAVELQSSHRRVASRSIEVQIRIEIAGQQLLNDPWGRAR